jgi:hypothetical protein
MKKIAYWLFIATSVFLSKLATAQVEETKNNTNTDIKKIALISAVLNCSYNDATQQLKKANNIIAQDHQAGKSYEKTLQENQEKIASLCEFVYGNSVAASGHHNNAETNFWDILKSIIIGGSIILSTIILAAAIIIVIRWNEINAAMQDGQGIKLPFGLGSAIIRQ